jgi:hypothetical protein
MVYRVLINLECWSLSLEPDFGCTFLLKVSTKREKSRRETPYGFLDSNARYPSTYGFARFREGVFWGARLCHRDLKYLRVKEEGYALKSGMYRATGMIGPALGLS